jgi:hypothetical protein
MTTLEKVERYEAALARSYDWDAVPVPDIGGPVTGVLDVDAGCRSLGYALDSWVRYVMPLHNGCQYGPDITEETPGAVPSYVYEQGARIKRESQQVSKEPLDQHPYFTNPVRLTFDPYEACKTDTGEDEEGVPLRRVWLDPLARTLWLAVKARRLTDQHFRRNCINAAKWIRQKPPMTADDLRVALPSAGLGYFSIRFAVEVYPYVVRILMREHNWPYFHPGKANVATEPLRWATNKVKTANVRYQT